MWTQSFGNPLSNCQYKIGFDNGYTLPEEGSVLIWAKCHRFFLDKLQIWTKIGCLYGDGVLRR